MRKLTKDSNIYAVRDRIVKAYLKILLRKFRKINQGTITSFDEINALQGVSTAYNEIIDISVKALKEVAQKTYKWLCDEDMLVDMWFSGWLNEYNPVTHYKWADEAERKKARLYEALMSCRTSAERKKQIDIAMRYWVKQFEQYADCIVSETLLKAYEDNGVKYVQWCTEKDGKVCSACHAREGKIYPIKHANLIPLHFNCRCWWIPV